MPRPPVEYPEYKPRDSNDALYSIAEIALNMNQMGNRAMRDAKTVTGDYTLDPVLDRVILVDTSSAGALVTITLPDPDFADHCIYTVVTIDATQNVTVDGGSGNINGVATVSINTQYDTLNVASDGSNYFRTTPVN